MCTVKSSVNGPRHFTTKFSHKVLLAHVQVYFDCADSRRVLVAILACGILLVTLGSSASQAMANCIPKVWHSTRSRWGSLRARCSVFHSLAFLQHSMHPRQGSPVLSCLVFLARPKHSMHRRHGCRWSSSPPLSSSQPQRLRHSIATNKTAAPFAHPIFVP